MRYLLDQRQKHIYWNCASERTERTLLFPRAISYLRLRIRNSRFDADRSIFLCPSFSLKPLLPSYDSRKACSTSAPYDISRIIRPMFCLTVAEIKGKFTKFSVLPKLGSAPLLSSSSANYTFCQWTAAQRAVPPFLSLQLMSIPLSRRQLITLSALAILYSSESSFLQGWVRLGIS